MDNIENLLEKIKKDKIAYTLVNSIKDTEKDSRLAVLEQVLNKLFSEKMRSFQDKESKDED